MALISGVLAAEESDVFSEKLDAIQTLANNVWDDPSFDVKSNNVEEDGDYNQGLRRVPTTDLSSKHQYF